MFVGQFVTYGSSASGRLLFSIVGILLRRVGDDYGVSCYVVLRRVVLTAFPNPMPIKVIRLKGFCICSHIDVQSLH